MGVPDSLKARRPTLAEILRARLVDALDGPMARMSGTFSPFGAFVDSVSDRYAELIVYGGLAVYYVSRENHTMLLWVFAAAAGSVLVSYVKARAEALGFEAGVGVLTRMERIMLLGPSLVLGVEEVGIPLV